MANLAPDTMQRFLDDNGVPLAGGFVNTYIAGTSTPQATYTDATLGTPNANPVVLDSGGKASIWLGAGLAYKFVIQNSSSVTIKTIDQIVNPSPSTPYAVNIGGTGVTSVTTAPTASSWAGWDANKNFSTNNLLEGYRSIVTAAGTTTLVVGDAYQQVFTGSTTQTVTMPVVSGLVLGQTYTITNLSSGVVTVQSSGANTIQAMAANTFLTLVCISTSGTGTSSWSWMYGPTTTPTTPTNTYYLGTMATNALWATSSNSFADGANTNGNTLTSVASNGITVSAAASNLAGITFTPSSSSAVYKITATTSMNNNFSGGGAECSLTDGTIVIVRAGMDQGASTTLQVPITLTGIYAPATSSAVTVKIQIRASNGTTSIQTSGLAPSITWDLFQIK